MYPHLLVAQHCLRLQAEVVEAHLLVVREARLSVVLVERLLEHQRQQTLVLVVADAQLAPLVLVVRALSMLGSRFNYVY
jgi:hypothetical protein